MTGFSFAGTWYLDYGYAERMREVIRPRLEAGKDPLPQSLLQINPDAEPPPIDARLTSGEQRIADYFRTPEGVGILSINGAMSRSGELCSYGNETLMAWAGILGRDEHTRAVLLRVNSPGGTVDSTKAFADAIQAVNAVKPVVTWTPFAASAAYFVASQSREIWVEDQQVGGVGSIGVLMVLTNQSKALEKQGIEVEIMRAEGSHQKALVNGIEPIADPTRAELQATLNACRSEFVGYVRRGRVGKIKSDEVFTGKMYTASQAVQLGLADRKGSFQQAYQRAIQLSK
ncbi:S49 family peptidase [Fibrella sp. WM1]|uniref:S49 family peptidase n=1 Tax=Fibrella musci TaxID=3242485 RepID=UPI003522E0C8